MRKEDVAEWQMLAVFGVDISTSRGHVHFTSLPQPRHTATTHKLWTEVLGGIPSPGQLGSYFTAEHRCYMLACFQFQGENKADGELQHDHVFIRVWTMTCSTK